MITLAIEAANKSLSVALFQDDTLIASESLENTLQHSVHLAPCVDTVMKTAGVTMKQLNQIAVSVGPGSYTGLRIGVTFAKTLSQTLNIPVLPLSSLHVLALSLENTNHLVVPFYDARRQNVFVGYYKNGINIEMDEHLPFAQVLEKVKAHKSLTFISPDMPLYKESILHHFPNASCIQAYPSAQHMLRAKNRQCVASDDVLPVYLKLAEAEENWNKVNGIVATNELIERANYA
ncbi:tRNA (adenosine(37)-N6)-threonylcarbamoyltransferase complex dimerization subunit type 1 TsaB [Carnobacteriaceae bacterium zg-ZUI240]|nr:tRNA (adenosine(37)-N6)-threonylcarbamoyltransferase complex dimerization subunit type 1 TsaB [Carnobacteriaceae bacterium zg-ZUI240]